MKRIGFIVGVAGLLITSTARADDDKGKGKRAVAGNAEAIFKRLDADGDKKVSKDEFQKISERLGQLGQGRLTPEMLEKLFGRVFERLDANNDGSLSLEEFKKLGGQDGKVDPEKIKQLIKRLRQTKGGDE